KLIKRTIFVNHLKFLTDREDELLQQLARLTKGGFRRHRKSGRRALLLGVRHFHLSFQISHPSFLSIVPLSILVYYSHPLVNLSLIVFLFTAFLTSLLTAHTKRRKQKVKNESETGASSASTPSAIANPTHHDDGAGSGVDGDDVRADDDRTLTDGTGTDGGAGAGTDGGGLGADDNAPGTNKVDRTRGAHPPAQKYRLTEAMKAIVWQLVVLSNECCRLENEKNELDVSNALVSEQGSRKILYQKIVAAFPSG
ncbi:hypothetical protein BD769DRAFT_1417397, partial [Suillus cothurnatus]